MTDTETKPQATTGVETTDVPVVSEPVKAVDTDATTPAASAVASAPHVPSTAGPVLSSSESTANKETEQPAAAAAAAAGPTPLAQLWKVAQETGHPEVWGVTLADPETHVPSQIVLQKYLNANDGNLAKAKDQLIKTLEWRAKMKPLELVKKTFSKPKFEGLGFVTSYAADGAAAEQPEGREVFTWNIYGGVASIDNTFGSLEE